MIEMKKFDESITKIEINGIQAIFLSQDESTIVRDEYGNKIRYENQWYYYSEESEGFKACYDPRPYGGGSFYAPPKQFFLCDK
jgi:hypothetical protein